MQSSVSNAEKAFEDFGNKTSEIGGKITAVETAVVAAAGAFIKSGLDYNATMETYQTSFEVMTGSAEKAIEITEQLSTMGAETPFEMTDLADTTQLLMQFGFSAEGAIESLSMLGDISQGSADKMGSIARAYGKMSSSCKVSLEDINMMIDAGFNPLQEISDTTGESMASLYDRISKGAMSVDEITASMQRSTSAGGRYFKSMEKQSKTFAGQMSTLQDNFSQLTGNLTSGLSEKIAAEILPVVNELLSALNDGFKTDGIQGMLDAIKDLSPQAERIVEVVESIGDKLSALKKAGVPLEKIAAAMVGLGPGLVVMGKLSAIAGGAVKAFSLLLSPIGLTVTAVMGVAGSIAYLWQTNEDFRASAISTWETLKGVVENVGTIVTTVFDGFGEDVRAIWEDVPEGAKSPLAALEDTFQLTFDNIKTSAGITAIALQERFSYLDTDAIADKFGTLRESLAGFLNDAITRFPFLQTAIDKAKQMFDAVKTAVETVWKIVQSFINGFVGSFDGDPSGLLTLGGTLISVFSGANPMVSAAIKLFQALLPQISRIVSVVGRSLQPIMEALGGTLGTVVTIVMDVANILVETLQPILASIIDAVTGIVESVLPVVVQLIAQLTPIIERIVQIVGELLEAIAPLIAQVMESLVPVIETIMETLTPIIDQIAQLISQLLPPIITIIDAIMDAVETLMPVITEIVDVVSDVIETVMEILSPIISLIGDIISEIMNIITPIITFIADVIAEIMAKIQPIVEFVADIFGTVLDTISGVFDGVKQIFGGLIDFITGIFTGDWEKAWNGLCDIVSGVWDGIWSIIKGFVNLIIDGINFLWSGIYDAVSGIVNGVGDIAGALGDLFGMDWHFSMPAEPPLIPHLAHGTDNWQGGFAVMNEGGRGELVNLPDGTQVIPHDISKKYAQEAARIGASQTIVFDYAAMGAAVAAAMEHVDVRVISHINGRAVADEVTPLINQNMGRQQSLDQRYT